MNLGMLAEQVKIWATYAPELRRRLHVVVVDDCSPDDQRPTAASIAGHTVASVRLYQLLQKIRWNWLAARNLGAKEAKTDWLLMTDMDHVVPERTLRRILDGPLDEWTAYRFKRVTVEHPWPYNTDSLPEYKAHNDSWLLTRRLFFHPLVGGYDERLSGCYGTSGEFTDRLTAVAQARVQLPEYLVRYPRDVIPDASTLPEVYTRKNDPVNDLDLAKRKAKRDRIPDWRPVHGLTPWELVASC
jgi:hypothetical protein